MAGVRNSIAALLLLCAATGVASAAISVIDDADNVISLARPALRIISLAPHTTELLFAAGASKRIIGVSAHSDYPAAANIIPSIGNISGIDIERIAKLKPDLIVAWGDGNAKTQLARLKQFNIPVFISTPNDFDRVASSIERLGVLAGTSEQAYEAATLFRQRWQHLVATYKDSKVVTVFYQLWKNPLMTLNDTHMISKVIEVCGGKNVFGSLAPLVPTVTTEAVLAANPDVIITPSDANETSLQSWQRYHSLIATKKKQLYTIAADEISRSGPRIIDAAEKMCVLLDSVRTKK
jgi:iron complex transport system substrate-binding protein